jgi:hypothetical protein
MHHLIKCNYYKDYDQIYQHDTQGQLSLNR